MSKETLVFVIGVLIFFTPFMGFPRVYTNAFLIILGLLLMFVGYRLRRLAFLRSLDDGKGERKADAFSENTTHDTRKDDILAEPNSSDSQPTLRV